MKYIYPLIQKLPKFIRTKVPWDKYIPYPPEVSIELTNHCNFKCIMCARVGMKRELGFMDKTLAFRLIDEIAGFPETAFAPQGFGESLLHKDYIEILVYARSKNLDKIIAITNASKLSKDIADKIIDTNLLDDIYFSLDGCNKETYEKLRKNASFERVMSNIKRFIEIRKKSGSWLPKIHMRIIRMKETESQIYEFKNYWLNILSDFDEVEINEFNTWVGKVEDRSSIKVKYRRRLPCRQLWKTALIFVNGDLTPCCYDVNGVLKVGNVNEHSIREIWNSKKLKELRIAHLKGDFDKIPLCKSCKEWF